MKEGKGGREGEAAVRPTQRPCMPPALLPHQRNAQAFNVCMSMTVNFRMEDHWMHDTEDLVHGVILTNRLFGLWERLLPKSDEELDIGGGETRQVVAESIRCARKHRPFCPL